MNREENGETNLEKYREYLRLLAQLQLDQQLQGKIDLSGVVQQTMLEAYQHLEKKTNKKEGLVAWLRRILANNLFDEIRKLKTEKRNVNRERSIDAAIEHSSSRLQAWLVDEHTSPSGHVDQQEKALQLSEALAKLPDAQREAVVLRHIQGLPLNQIAAELGRSHAAVAGLLKRGLQHLRNQMQDWT